MADEVDMITQYLQQMLHYYVEFKVCLIYKRHVSVLSASAFSLQPQHKTQTSVLIIRDITLNNIQHLLIIVSFNIIIAGISKFTTI